MNRSRLAFAAKLAVSLAILAFALSRVDWQAISSTLAGASPLPLVGALVLMVATNAMVAVRWRLLAERLAIPISLKHAIELIFTSLFLGQVLPGAVGGDAVRVWLTWRMGKPAGVTLASVVADRLIALAGIVVTVIVVSLPLLATPLWLSLPPAAPYVAGLAVVAVAVLAAAAYAGAFSGWLARWRWIRHVMEMIGAIRSALLSPAAIVGLGISVATQIIGVATVWMIAQALHLPISLVQCLAVVPVAVLVAAIPISINGWGVRESVMIVGLGLYGVPAPDALIVSLLIGFGAIVASMPGLVFWKTMPGPTRP